MKLTPSHNLTLHHAPLSPQAPMSTCGHRKFVPTARCADREIRLICSSYGLESGAFSRNPTVGGRRTDPRLYGHTLERFPLQRAGRSTHEVEARGPKGHSTPSEASNIPASASNITGFASPVSDEVLACAFNLGFSPKEVFGLLKEVKTYAPGRRLSNNKKERGFYASTRGLGRVSETICPRPKSSLVSASVVCRSRCEVSRTFPT